MKKYLLNLVIFVFIVFTSGVVSATGGQIQPPVEGDLFDVIADISGYVRPLILVVFLGVIIYSGFTIQTALGDEEKTKKGWQALQAGVIGFIVIALAPVIVDIVRGLLGAN